MGLSLTQYLWFRKQRQPKAKKEADNVDPVQSSLRFVGNFKTNQALGTSLSISLARDLWTNDNANMTTVTELGLVFQTLDINESYLLVSSSENGTPLALLRRNDNVPAGLDTTTGIQICCIEPPQPSCCSVGTFREYALYEFATIASLRTDQSVAKQNVTMTIPHAEQSLNFQRGDKDPWVYTSDQILYWNETACARVSKHYQNNNGWNIKRTNDCLDPMIVVLHVVCANHLQYLRQEQKQQQQTEPKNRAATTSRTNASTGTIASSILVDLAMGVVEIAASVVVGAAEGMASVGGL